MRPRSRLGRGFTLVEMIMVIVITGILGSMVAKFIKSAIDSYVDTARRAELTDMADTVLRRMTRELRLAVPNSVRVTSSGSVVYLELLLAKTGGRYVGTSAESCFVGGCSSITTLGSVVETFSGVPGVPGGPATGRYKLASIAGGSDRIVIYNQYNNEAGGCGADNPSAYCGDNTSLLDAATPVTDAGGQDVFSFANKLFVPAGGSPSQRFQIVDGAVTYACDTAAKTVTRYSGYGINALQIAPVGGVANLVATHVSACSFAYAQGVLERWGLATLSLELTEQGETVSLYYEMPINNSP
jgi:MSHA biogenesis protein MshO